MSFNSGSTVSPVLPNDSSSATEMKNLVALFAVLVPSLMIEIAVSYSKPRYNRVVNLPLLNKIRVTRYQSRRVKMSCAEYLALRPGLF